MSKNTKPTHRAYATKTNPDGKDSWREIGALWPHKDGNGFHLRLDLIPRDQDVITIRKVVPKRPKAELAKISLVLPGGSDVSGPPNVMSYQCSRTRR